jgi:hypothetical protein
MGPKTTEKASAMEWANTETDNFVSINKYIFSCDEQDGGEHVGPKTNMNTRVKSLPKTGVLSNDTHEADLHFPTGTGIPAKLAEFDALNERTENRPARYSGFFSTMKLMNNEGLFPSAYKDTQDNIFSKQKGKFIIQIITPKIGTSYCNRYA